MTRRSKIPCFNSCDFVRFGMRVFKDALVVHDCHEYDGTPLIENQFMSCYAININFCFGKHRFDWRASKLSVFLRVAVVQLNLKTSQPNRYMKL